MRRDVRVYLQDMQIYLAQLASFTDGRTSTDFHEDLLLRRAVERVHEIVAEIMRRMVAVAPETADRVPDFARIISFRNVIAHEYDRLDEDEVWEITVERLPVLKQQIDAWALELGMEAPPEPAS